MNRFTSLLLLSLAACPGNEGDSDTTPSTGDLTDPGTGTPTTTDATSETPTTGDPSTTSVDPSTTTGDPSTSTGPGDTTGETGETGETTTGGSEVLVVAGFETPESATWSPVANAWFVSNIVGNPGEKDGNGYISRINPDGTVDELKWLEGLDGPAGLREYMGFLVVADVDTVRAYDVLTGESFFDVPIPGAVFLNDVVVGPDQYAYVSDTATNTIHRFLPGEMPEIVLMDPSLDAPNGVMFLADQLYIGAIGSTTDPDILGELLIINGDVAETQGTYEGKLDGIEVDGANFLITEFTGQLRRVSPDGNTVELVRDFAAEDGLLSTADLGWNPETRQVAIPDLLGNQVAFWVVP